MATLVQAEIPAAEFALAETFEVCSGVTVECERFITQPTTTVMPLVWVRETSPDAFEAALDQDPTVETYTQLTDTGSEYLYEMRWDPTIDLVLQFLTMECGAILEMVGSASGWRLRVFFPERDRVRSTADFCETHNITVTINSIRQLDGESVHKGFVRAGMTADQHEALSLAYEMGYFSVPRAVDLDDLAVELDISHQALSERLRRAHQSLIEETLSTRVAATS